MFMLIMQFFWKYIDDLMADPIGSLLSFSGLTFYEIEKIFESVIENLKQAVIITPTEVMLIEKDATKVNVHIESKISNLENEVL